MLYRLAALITRRPRLLLIACLLLVALAGAAGIDVKDRMSSGAGLLPIGPSQQATETLERDFGIVAPNLALLVTAAEGVNDPTVTNAGQRLTEQLAAEPGVTDVVSYWSLQAPPLASRDGTAALVVGRIVGDERTAAARAATLAGKYSGQAGPVQIEVGGAQETFRQIGLTIEADLLRAELLAVPLTLVALLLVFRSVVAAALPLLVAGLAVVGTLGVLAALTHVTDVSVFALNLTTAMGLGLGIDYSLFIVSRFREELRTGLTPVEAVTHTMLTAGRTVAFSAATVMISLSVLLIFPQVFLRSFAYAGAAVVASAAVAALVVLPAILVLLGRRIDRLTVLRPRQDRSQRWASLAYWVMRRPIGVASLVTVVLLVLGLPFLGVVPGAADDRVLPADNPARQFAEQVRSHFNSNELSALAVVAAGPASLTQPQAVQYAAELSRLPGVARVDGAAGSYQDGEQVYPPTTYAERFSRAAGNWLAVVPAVEPLSPEAEDLVQAVRSTPSPVPVVVGGTSANLVDAEQAMFSRFPLALGLVAAVTFVLLALMLGSLLLPAKALLLNMLSLSAVYGAMVWIFQDGHLSSVLGFTPTGTLEATTPILMFCVAFGLSMDYEVFLLARIKEEYERTGNTRTAVAFGLQRSAGLITAAAVLLAVVFLCFATSDVTIIKMFGIGVALAVIIDATLIRALLVPAAMALAGPANWWAPSWLRRLHERSGLQEHPRHRRSMKTARAEDRDDLLPDDIPTQPRHVRPLTAGRTR